jgi:hypothetical protein
MLSWIGGCARESTPSSAGEAKPVRLQAGECDPRQALVKRVHPWLRGRGQFGKAALPRSPDGTGEEQTRATVLVGDRR